MGCKVRWVENTVAHYILNLGLWDLGFPCSWNNVVRCIVRFEVNKWIEDLSFREGNPKILVYGRRCSTKIYYGRWGDNCLHQTCLTCHNILVNFSYVFFFFSPTVLNIWYCVLKNGCSSRKVSWTKFIVSHNNRCDWCSWVIQCIAIDGFLFWQKIIHFPSIFTRIYPTLVETL